MGSFDMDDFIEYVIEFIRTLGPDLHVMAVCQPTVPVLAAISIMSQAGDPQIPKSMTLMGGPVDARKNPTKVNCFATARSIDWFKHTVIMPVPPNYPGYMRQVYPGFLQLAGFMSLNIARHIDSHLDMFKNLFLEEDEKAEADKKFYDEYLSVMDLPAEFYIQTIKQVFQDFDLAKGKLISRGRKVDTRSITKCALLGIEGERDDIAAVGQTKAALDLCDNIPNDKKHYHMQHGVGHYGVFSGSKFKKHIVPVITDFINRV
jgi:poly(3-hydroxybutyrate) depolymerase